MYLVSVAVDTPGWEVVADELHRALGRSARVVGHLEHAYLSTRPGRAVLSLYVQGHSREDAELLAEELSRRAMMTLALVGERAGEWAVTSIHTA